MRICLVTARATPGLSPFAFEEEMEVVFDPSLCIIKCCKYCSLVFFLCYCESLATAVLFTSVFHMSSAAREAALRHSINICRVNELTFLKGQGCKRGSPVKVYNLENINYVEMVCVIV